MIAFALTIIALLLFQLTWSKRREWDTARLASTGVIGGALLFVGSLTFPNLLYVGKVLGRLAMPSGLLWMALIALCLYFWQQRARLHTALAVLVFVAYTVAGSPALGSAMLAWLESDYVSNDPTEGRALDAVFVLGGGTSAPRVEGRDPGLADAGDRVLTGARVFKSREVGVIVTSGSTIPGIGLQRDVAEEAAVILTDLGVERSAIVTLPEPKNSSEEVAEYKRLAEERGWEDVGVVTSAWHMRRVMKLCEAVGLHAEPLPADFDGYVGWDGLLSMIPDGGGFRDVQRASWELLGAAVGR